MPCLKIKPVSTIPNELPKQDKRQFDRIRSKLNIPMLSKENRIKKSDIKFKDKTNIKKIRLKK